MTTKKVYVVIDPNSASPLVFERAHDARRFAKACGNEMLVRDVITAFESEAYIADYA